jgi:hypothetical protein
MDAVLVSCALRRSSARTTTAITLRPRTLSAAEADSGTLEIDDDSWCYVSWKRPHWLAVFAKHCFAKQEQNAYAASSVARSRGTRCPRFLSSPPAAARPARAATAAAAAAPNAADSARIKLEHFGIDVRADEVLPLREQALYPASGGVPFLPGVENFVRAMNQAGVRMALATSSPTRLLEAKSAGKEEFFAVFEGVVCWDDVKHGKADTGHFWRPPRFFACLLL